MINRVDFGYAQAKRIKASGQRIVGFEVCLKHKKGKLTTTFPVEYTGRWNSWQAQKQT
jgi:hypothetical protein